MGRGGKAGKLYHMIQERGRREIVPYDTRTRAGKEAGDKGRAQEKLYHMGQKRGE